MGPEQGLAAEEREDALGLPLETLVSKEKVWAEEWKLHGGSRTASTGCSVRADRPEGRMEALGQLCSGYC